MAVVVIDEDDVVFIIDKPITIDSLEKEGVGDHPSLLFSFSSIFFYMSNVFYDWPRRVHILPTKEPTFWSCPGSSFYTPSSKEKKKSKRSTRSHRFHFLSLSQDAPFFFPPASIVVGSHGFKPERRWNIIIIHKRKRNVVWHNAFWGPFTLNELLMCVSQSAVNDTTSRAHQTGPNCFWIFY